MKSLYQFYTHNVIPEVQGLVFAVIAGWIVYSMRQRRGSSRTWSVIWAIVAAVVAGLVGYLLYAFVLVMGL
jgi:predicted branched-subunit amino acid permease